MEAANPLAVEHEPLDLNALIHEVLSLYAEPQDKGRLAADLAPSLPHIKGDASQLRQVIHNLVQNALDAVHDRPDGRVTVRSQLTLTETGAPRSVRLLIKDNGPGFDPATTAEGTGITRSIRVFRPRSTPPPSPYQRGADAGYAAVTM